MKDQVKKIITQYLQAFFQEEQGNRITSNNIEGFAGKLLTAIDKMEMENGKSKDGNK